MAMQPQQPPAQSPPDQGQGGGGEVQQLVEGVYTGLMKFQEMVAQSSPQLAEKLQAVIQGFQMVVEALVKGGGGQDQGPKGPTAGGPGAVPAM